MRVLVTGGREFRELEWLYAGLELLHEVTGGISEIIEGGARGADTLAANWANWRQVKLTTVKADWQRHNRAAGALRNIQMADLKPDLVLACPGGRGTTHMVATARQRGIRVIFLEKMAQVADKRRGPGTAARTPPPIPPVIDVSLSAPAAADR